VLVHKSPMSEHVCITTSCPSQLVQARMVVRVNRKPQPIAAALPAFMDMESKLPAFKQVIDNSDIVASMRETENALWNKLAAASDLVGVPTKFSPDGVHYYDVPDKDAGIGIQVGWERNRPVPYRKASLGLKVATAPESCSPSLYCPPILYMLSAAHYSSDGRHYGNGINRAWYHACPAKNYSIGVPYNIVFSRPRG
jgi:hypothetical protein